jgi:hypothetical protein
LEKFDWYKAPASLKEAGALLFNGIFRKQLIFGVIAISYLFTAP